MKTKSEDQQTHISSDENITYLYKDLIDCYIAKTSKLDEPFKVFEEEEHKVIIMKSSSKVGTSQTCKGVPVSSKRWKLR